MCNCVCVSIVSHTFLNHRSSKHWIELNGSLTSRLMLSRSLSPSLSLSPPLPLSPSLPLSLSPSLSLSLPFSLSLSPPPPPPPPLSLALSLRVRVHARARVISLSLVIFSSNVCSYMCRKSRTHLGYFSRPRFLARALSRARWGAGATPRARPPPPPPPPPLSLPFQPPTSHRKRGTK
jgi:hypothetical protein